MPATARRALTYDGVGYWKGRGGVQVAAQVDSTAKYRPVRIAKAGTNPTVAELQASLPHFPSGVTLVPWPFSTPSGGRLNTVMDTLGANDVLVLPEAIKADGSPDPYLVDTANGFIRDSTHYFWMARFTRGVVGLGPNSMIDTAASSFTAPQQSVPFIDPFDGTTKSGVQQKVFATSTLNAYVGNLQFRSKSYGGIAYNMLGFSKGGGIVERVYAKGSGRGFKNSPNGEAGFVNFSTSGGDTNLTASVYNTEVDCRDDTGARVTASPVMFNKNTGVNLIDAYLHHSIAGMPTSWSCSGPITYTRVRSEYNGSGGGGLNGSCFNFELCDGTAEIVDCDLICNYHGNTFNDGTSNSELHISGGSNQAVLTVNVRNSRIDAGPRTDGALSVQLFGYTPQLGLDVHRYDAAGGAMSVFVYGG
jgi:hypothetical protein